MSTTTLTDSEKRERLKEIVGDFDTAMLVTRTEDGRLRSRPLSIVHNQDDQEGLYFSTAIDSPKARELEADPCVNVCMQDKRRFVSVTRVARLVKDRALIDKLWSEAWKIWFPSLKDREHSGEGRARRLLVTRESEKPMGYARRSHACLRSRQTSRKTSISSRQPCRSPFSPSR
jgi:general stress protein 26